MRENEAKLQKGTRQAPELAEEELTRLGELPLLRAAACMEQRSIPPPLVVNAGEVSVELYPRSKYGYSARGAAQSAQQLLNDQRVYTHCMASSMAGEILKMQQLWKGKTPQRHSPGEHAMVYQGHRESGWATAETLAQ